MIFCGGGLNTPIEIRCIDCGFRFAADIDVGEVKAETENYVKTEIANFAVQSFRSMVRYALFEPEKEGS